MKWVLWLLWDPVRALDLRDGSGAIDHGKVVGLFTYLTMFGILAVYVVGKGKLLPLGHTIALISTAYGWVGWRTFLASKAAARREGTNYEYEREVERVTEGPDADPE